MKLTFVLLIIYIGTAKLCGADWDNDLSAKTGSDYSQEIDELILSSSVIKIKEPANEGEKLVQLAVKARLDQPYLLPWLRSECLKVSAMLKGSETQQMSWRNEEKRRRAGDYKLGAGYKYFQAAGSWNYYYYLSEDVIVNGNLMGLPYPSLVNPIIAGLENGKTHQATWIISLEALIHEPFEEYIKNQFESEVAGEHMRGVWYALMANYLRLYPCDKDDSNRIMANNLLPHVIDNAGRPRILCGIALETYSQLAIEPKTPMMMIDRYSYDDDIRMVLASLNSLATIMKRDDSDLVSELVQEILNRNLKHVNPLVRDCATTVKIFIDSLVKKRQ